MAGTLSAKCRIRRASIAQEAPQASMAEWTHAFPCKAVEGIVFTAARVVIDMADWDRCSLQEGLEGEHDRAHLARTDIC